MLQLILNLDEHSQLPIIELDNGLLALLDTGASVPVWVDADESLFVERYNAIFIKQVDDLSGFGGKTCANEYHLDCFTVGKLVYPNIRFLASRLSDDTPYQLILSAPMFDGLIYTIDNVNHRLLIDIPDDSYIRNVYVTDSNGNKHALINKEAAETAEAYREIYGTHS